jgi:DHA2 family multidrug resistance protein
MNLRTGFTPNMDIRFVLWPQVLQGLALVCFFIPIIALTFSGLEPWRMARASGLVNCIRTLFTAIGASVTTTLWERREAVHHVRLSGLLDPYNPLANQALDQMTAQGGLTLDQAHFILTRQITNQGYILAATEIYHLCTLAFLFLLVVVWLARPAKEPQGGKGPAAAAAME